MLLVQIVIGVLCRMLLLT
ncbi:hypothetical protein pipiens_013154, partial [Culex pipiens pipiens]